MGLAKRLRRELERRNIEPEILDLKAELPTGTTKQVINGALYDDPLTIQISLGVDMLPSLLEHGVEDPANIWSDADMRKAAGLNVVWETAREHKLSPRQGRQLFDKLSTDGVRQRNYRQFTRDAAERAYLELFANAHVFRIGSDDPFDGDE